MTSTLPVVTDAQLDLVRRTIAPGATPDELRLFLYDCARRGVHPLDKLIHFTKRSGKYTPITSIDFMRTRAADTGEYAGSDDADFPQPPHDKPSEPPRSASVTVWRLVQGTRCPFSATARWDEYYPGDGPVGTMWRKMPHTMLAKCAEALALRKGFPGQLAGLYAREEMDQAGSESLDGGAPPSPNNQDHKPVPNSPPPADGTVTLQSVTSAPTSNKHVTRWTVVDSHGVVYHTIKPELGALAAQLAHEGVSVRIESKETNWGAEVVGLARWEAPELDAVDATAVVELTAGDIPF